MKNNTEQLNGDKGKWSTKKNTNFFFLYTLSDDCRQWAA